MYSRITTYSVAFHWKNFWEGFKARVIFFFFLILISLWKQSLYLTYYRSLCHADTCTVMQKPGQITESRYGRQLFWIAVRGIWRCIWVEVWSFPQASFIEKCENLDYSLCISLLLIILIHHDLSCWQYWKKKMCS